MSSPLKKGFHTPAKKSIRSQFVKQENSKKRSQISIKNNTISSPNQPKTIQFSDNLLKGRSLTPQPQKSKPDGLFFKTNTQSIANNRQSKRSLTPSERILKIDGRVGEEDRYSQKSFRSKTPEPKYRGIEDGVEIMQEHDSAILEREKNKLRNNFIRNMYYIEHKYRNCPCYKCICGKCFCPMRKLRPAAPLLTSVYHQDYMPKSASREDCPFKKLQEFQYKPQTSNLDQMKSTYKDSFQPHAVQKPESFEKKEKYEKKDVPLFSSTNYNQNYKDWGRLKGFEKADLMCPLDNIQATGCPLKNKTLYNESFAPKDKNPMDKAISELLKSKRDKATKNPLSTDFRAPFETENQAKFKAYEVNEVPRRTLKKERTFDEELNGLLKPKYESDYMRNFRNYRLRPFVCPARVELDRLARLESQSVYF